MACGSLRCGRRRSRLTGRRKLSVNQPTQPVTDLVSSVPSGGTRGDDLLTVWRDTWPLPLAHTCCPAFSACLDALPAHRERERTGVRSPFCPGLSAFVSFDCVLLSLACLFLLLSGGVVARRLIIAVCCCDDWILREWCWGGGVSVV